MKYLLISVICLSFLFYAFSSRNASASLHAPIKDKVVAFAKAIEARNLSQLDQLLHKNFRVVANQYPTADKLSLIPKKVYLSLIEAQKIGGSKYEVKFDHISVKEHSATAIVQFEGEKSTMYLTLLLINDGQQWSIIEDMAFIK